MRGQGSAVVYTREANLKELKTLIISHIDEKTECPEKFHSQSCSVPSVSLGNVDIVLVLGESEDDVTSGG